jgi:outer membrane protein OmpA-like peptidoglycan-associated protein
VVQRLVILLAIAAAGLVSGCVATVPTASERTEAADLNATIDALGQDLAQQLAQADRLALISKRQVVVDRFVDSQTGQVNVAYRRIAERVPEVMTKKLTNFSFRQMQGKDIAGADYVLAGSVSLESHGEKNKDYRIFASVTDLKSGMVVANARVWLRATKDLEVAAEAVYSESPMFLADRSTAALVTTTKTLPGAQADSAYIAQLTTNALLNEAETAYNRGELPLATQMYNDAALRPDGQVMRTYSGLYLVHQRTGNPKGAERAFSDLVGLGLVAQQISVKFLFKVGSTSFMEDMKQSNQYAMWLRQIANQIASRKVCLEVSGHTSRSGSESFNERLSLQRAELIARTLIQHEPSLQNRLKAVGRGFRDNVIGTGSDDARDTIDRRVDFKITQC